MSLLKILGLARRAEPPPSEPAPAPREQGRAVFQEAAIAIEDYHHERVVIIALLERGARIAYAARMDLPFRVRLIAPTLKRNCWCRVVWQEEGRAELELQEEF